MAVAMRKANSDRGVQCEVAAWELGRLLGWTNLLSATVVRDLPPGPGAPAAQHAVRLALLGAHPHVDLGRFADDDLWRAATFDYLAFTTDRHGGNWLAVELVDGNAQLVLIDHEHAFDLPGRTFRSEIFDRKCEDALPDWVKVDVKRLLDEFPSKRLALLLSPASTKRLQARAEKVIACERLGNLAR
jgi:hypothetical protein